METREINTKIINIENAVGKESNKVYWKVNTGHGYMNCHESTVIDKLRPFVGGIANIVIVETPKKDGNGMWVNIKDVVENSVNEPDATYHQKKFNGREQAINKTETKSVPIPSDNKSTTMYVSYAKDLYNMLDDNLPSPKRMELAIALIKHAIDEFS